MKKWICEAALLLLAGAALLTAGCDDTPAVPEKTPEPVAPRRLASPALDAAERAVSQQQKALEQ